jgi:hypothetical protein
MLLRWFMIVMLLVIQCYRFSVQAGYAQPAIEITSPVPPPAWALLELELLRANSQAVEIFADKYLDERGYLLHVPRWGCVDGTDDAIETFAKWPLLHALGASESALQLYNKALEGHFLQYAALKTTTTDVAKDGAYHKEFPPMMDWHHNGEGMQGFFQYGLSDPADRQYQKRMKRYVGFYMNKDPEAPNYDPEHKIIRSIWNGSKGPMLRNATCADWVGDPVEGTFYLFHSAQGNDKMIDFMENYQDMLDRVIDYLPSAGDNPLNLLSTQLALHAYMFSHEQEYKDWLLEYVDAWKERTIQNGGNIPTNIGLDGTLGGEFDGKWYKGTFGWDFTPWSPELKITANRNHFTKGMWPGFSNALLVTGDQAYVDILRSQLDNLYAEKRIENGKVVIPQNYGDDGWYNWTSNLYVPRLIEIYMWSMDRKDLDRIPKNGWIGFLEGKNPEYPVQALQKEFSYIRNRMEALYNDDTTPDTRLADWALKNTTPAATHELVRLMLGGYMTGRIWVLHSRVRYFDPVNRRAGIPEDVASLVTEMTREMTKVTLVNTNQVEAHEVIVQTGGYGEHQCRSVEIDGREYPVNNRYFTVRLAPGAGAELVIYAKRYANQPTLAFPWHSNSVPESN